MKSDAKVEYLIVDTSAFIRNAAIQDIAANVITPQDVVNEITNKRQLRRLVVLPYDLIIKDVFPENIHFVTEFSKKTGDYRSLSATDIKVIALTYQLEKEKVGTQHLKDVPITPVKPDISINLPDNYSHNVAGFFLPDNDKQGTEKETVEHCTFNQNEDTKELDLHNNLNTVILLKNGSADSTSESDDLSEYSSISDYETATSDLENIEKDSLPDKFSALKCNPEDLELDNGKDVDDILPAENCEEFTDEDQEIEESESEDDNDEGWITPRNIVKVKKDMDADIQEEKPAKVACLTTDFAMQNVLKQIGLQVVSLDGRVIKQLRTFILRCYTCFKTTSIMTKEFCPNCGNKTLKKVAVSLDENGKQQIHINHKRPLTARGKKFSLPTPQGGKHANNPILFEDQPRPDQRPSRLARTRNDPLNDDYVAGYSPFVMRDINSKSAILGIRSGTDIKHWMRKNPNQARKKRK
ncbi:RNA-binding protein NOB1 [Neodiprion pinetum]|uniref:RNA-binding protein NOB1 n=1 Tax=Neodiprion pinetum TaxID=441929 RepID=UPI001EDF9E85|nr:RNA-binding protein NOB1 [Neodiprion pinetum]